MQRRQFILSTFKTLCITYVSTQLPAVAFAGGSNYNKKQKKILLAFMEAVVPGCDINNANNLTGFYDSTLPLAKYVRVLVFRIKRMTKKAGYKKSFYNLSVVDREKIIQYGYNNSTLDRELFHGAIYLSQVTLYGGIFNKNSNADFIGFEGASSSAPNTDLWHYADMEGQESPMTENGNYH